MPTSEFPAPAGLSFFRSRFWRVWWIALAAKLALAAWLPFSSDEAYYWVWGHFPDWGYFDHPPAVGWLFWLGRGVDVIGQSSRWPGVLLGHCTFLVWRELLKPLFDDREQASWLTLLALSPFLGLGSLIVTPDIPLVFFWSLALLCVRRALETSRPAWFTALGAALGLGFCSKYPIVLFVPACLGWIAFAKDERRRVRWPLVGLTVATGLAFCFPVLWWNARHDWASFRFQLDHGLEGGHFSAKWPFEYLTAQIAILFPPIAWFALNGREPRQARWLRWFAWTPFVFFLLASFRARGEANWPIAAYPAALTLAFLNLRGHRWGRFWRRATVGAWAAALIVVTTQIARPWLPIDPRKLKTSEFEKFDPLLPQIAGLSDVFAGSYQMAAALSYRSKRMIPKLALMNRRDFYDFQSASWPKGDRFYLAVEGAEPLPTWLAERGFRIESTRAATKELQIFEVVRRAQDRDR